MGLDEQTRGELVATYWHKSMQTIEEAEVAIAASKWNMAANRIYYALFHGVAALLISDQHPVGTHRGTKATLGQFYVLTGKITQDEGRFFAQMSSLRDKADYDVIFTATEEEIRKYYPQAISFLQRIAFLLGIDFPLAD